MEPRLIVAYALIALTALLGVGLLVTLRYRSRDRTLARRLRRRRETWHRNRAMRSDDA